MSFSMLLSIEACNIQVIHLIRGRHLSQTWTAGVLKLLLRLLSDTENILPRQTGFVAE
jgi:hypothetical protein